MENLAIVERSRPAIALSESEAHDYPAGPAAPAPAAPPVAAPDPRPTHPPAAAQAAAKAAAKAAPAPPAQALVPAPPVPAAPDFSDYGYIARCTLNFTADRVLGAGAYGTVYHGVDSSNAVEFAAKRLECQDVQQREYLERMTAAEVRVFHLADSAILQDAVFRNMSSLNS